MASPKRCLQAPAEELAAVEDAARNNQHAVGTSDLVISHEELTRFEKANPAVAGQAEAEDGNRGGAPSRYQWDDIWVELCAMIFFNGLPETQADLVQHIATWLEAQVEEDQTACGGGCGRGFRHTPLAPDRTC